jgi:hypothetical protein
MRTLPDLALYEDGTATRRSENDYPTAEPIVQRWSPRRAFSERPVDDAALLSLFEAARRAPWSRNEQPWRFVVGRRGR